MDHHAQDHKSSTPDQMNSKAGAAAEPVRSRWTPKPEQILILESIFNSGMVNPPKDETARIRKLLEKFGAVGDANVFYWFQNRRSRSRRRQRQLQSGLMAADPRAGAAGLAGSPAGTRQVGSSGTSAAIYFDPTSSSSSSTSSSSYGGAFYNPCYSSVNSSSSSSFMGDDGADDLFSISRQMGFMENAQNPYLRPPDASQFQYHPETITVFINGVASEVPIGAIDLRAMFGPNAMLVHSSGFVLPVNEYGILMQSLQIGESYFLVSGPS